MSYGPLHSVNYKPPKIVRHRSALSLVRQLERGMKIRGANGRSLAWDGPDGPICVVDSIRKMGFWGFASTKGPPRIDWWASAETAPEQVIALLAHELGHLRRLVRRKRSVPAEEAWADTFAAIALAAFRAMRGRR